MAHTRHDLTGDDLRAAVTTGVIDERQAASLIALSQARRGVRARMSGLDEPFELFRGFNEIFIVVGLTILYGGYNGLTGLGIIASQTGYINGMIYAGVGLGAIAALSVYFTRVRRMVAPSIALSVMLGLSAVQFGASLGAAWNMDLPERVTFAAIAAGAVLTVHYLVFRVPFAMALIGISVLATAFGFAAQGGAVPTSVQDVFLLSTDGPFALITVGLGIVGVAVALWFDMSDPHRLTRSAASGFWLHVLAAPAIVNTVALTLFQRETLSAHLVLAAFLLFLAVFAIVIDRRSFLVAGVGYVVALAFTVIEGSAFVLILLLGAGLVLLGAKWEAMRRAMMRALPRFPGKTRLPPYDIDPEESTA